MPKIKLPLWEVVLHDGFGFFVYEVTATTRANAIRGAYQQATRFRSVPFQFKRATKFSSDDENRFILDRLWDKFPNIYLLAWEPDIKGTELIKRARKALTLEQWGKVWSR